MTEDNMNRAVAQAFAPFALYLMLLIAWPIKRLIQLKMPDGKLKRALLRRIDGSDRTIDPEKAAQRLARKSRIYSIGKNAATVIRRKIGI